MSGYSWEYWILDRAPLLDARQWVLQGKHELDGACSYEYPAGPTVLPEGGWEIRSIAIDFARCAKLMEEGYPTETPPVSPDGKRALTIPVTAGNASRLQEEATTSTRSAWQQVVWYDILGIQLNYDVTQITWSYNGSTVSSGSVIGYLWWFTGSGWALIYGYHAGSYGPGNSYYLGNTWSKFGNAFFCPLPVFTRYVYNKMWGHPDGHATKAQSSDSDYECLPLHWDDFSAYGTFSG